MYLASGGQGILSLCVSLHNEYFFNFPVVNQDVHHHGMTDFQKIKNGRELVAGTTTHADIMHLIGELVDNNVDRLSASPVFFHYPMQHISVLK